MKVDIITTHFWNRKSIFFAMAAIMLLSTGLAATVRAQDTYIRHDELFSVHFSTETDGWACGRWGTIWNTSDGGKTWETQNGGVGKTLSDIFFLDADTGWAVGKGGTIIHTTDGGDTWTLQESPVNQFHMSVCFISAEKGWIASEQTHILYTEDGGKNWTVQFSDEFYKLKSISFADESTGWAVGEYGFIYATKDGGKTWVHQGGYYRINDETLEVETGVFLFDVVALDPETAIAVGADGVVIKTQDGGASWNQVETGAPDARFLGVAFDGRETVVIGGKGAYLISSDKAQTWAPIRTTPSAQYSWLYGYSAVPNTARFAAVGEDGAIYISNSTGDWQRVDY